MTREEFKKRFLFDKTYLGDSVYIHHDGYHFILETRNGLPDDPSNRIALEPAVVDAFLSYRDAFYLTHEKVLEAEKELNDGSRKD